MKTLIRWLWGVILVASCTSQPKNDFKDNGYQSDTVYISGQVLNFPEGKTLQVAYMKFVEDEQVRLDVTPDSAGHFEIQVPVINSTRLFLYYFMKASSITLFAEPGEKIEIQSDWKEETLAFSGEHARTHQDVYDYWRYVDSLALPYSYIETMDRGISHEEFYQKMKAEWCKNDSLLNGYLQLHSQMSERAVRQVQIMNLNHFAFQLMQRRFVLDFKKREPFPDSYMNHADSIFSIFPRPYTLGDLTFLRDYLDYYYEQHTKVAGNMKMLFDYLKEHKGMELTEEQQMDGEFLNTPEMRVAVSEASDAMSSNPSYEAALIERWCGGVGLVSMPEDLKQLMYAYYHYFYLDGSRKAMHEDNVARFRSWVKNPTLAEPVLQYQERLVKLANMSLDEQLSLMDYDHLKGCETGEELFREIVKPYEGKLVYLDVWGTWCSPCKREMEHASGIKQAMKGKDVVFLYLANRSPEESWKNVIKEYGLTGEQVVHYNLPDVHQDRLEKYLGVRSFPTYMLVDRKGNIVDRNPPRPSSEKRLVDYLNECLQKKHSGI